MLSVAVSKQGRQLVIWSALLALFLGALDALIMSAAMPSIVADLGGLHLYAWVYSAYFLARAVSMPIFGKLADRYDEKKLFLFSIFLFLCASVGAGCAQSMIGLVVNRIFQGIGAGGNFALVYIVLSRISQPENRAKTLSLGSVIWGISSMIGPSLGGWIVTYFSWRWIFFVNIPVAILSLYGIARFLPSAPRSGAERQSRLDVLGILLFSSSILGLLIIFIAGGREIGWKSPSMFFLGSGVLLLGTLFYLVEKRAEDPMIDLRFFRYTNFSLANGAIFFASFSIFSLFAYAPLYIQGSLGLSPMQVGIAMLSLSLGWSSGAFAYGRISTGGGERRWAMFGALLLVVASLFTTQFSLETQMVECFFVFLVIGVGMGFVSLSTLILVQDSVSQEELGIATSLHQFSRSLGGTIGVGISGGIMTAGFFRSLDGGSVILSEKTRASLEMSLANLLQPEFKIQLPQKIAENLKTSLLSGVFDVFLVSLFVSLCCLLCCFFIKRLSPPR